MKTLITPKLHNATRRVCKELQLSKEQAKAIYQLVDLAQLIGSASVNK